MQSDYCEIIDYYPARFKKTYFRAFLTKHPKMIEQKLKMVKKEKQLEPFRKQNLTRTKYYKNNELLKKANFDYNCYITGSDQVWNTSFLRSGERKKTYSYFLDFAPDDKILASYAASFGTTKFPEDLKKDLEKSLKRFDIVSVREKTGLEIVKDAGVSEAFLVPDPTLLLKKEDYEKFVKEEKNEKGYTFLYMLGNHKKDATEVLAYAQEKGLKSVECEEFGIEDWLSEIYHSDLVVTNSFHGTVFSILFEKPFVSLLIEGSGMNDRITTLLEKLELSDRIYKGDSSIIDKEIDWEKVNKNLEKLRESGYEYIDRIVRLEGKSDAD